MFKGSAKRFPFTRKEIIEKEEAIKRFEREIFELEKAKRWNEALKKAREVTDDLQKFISMRYILQHVKLNEEILRVENSASSWYLLGYALYYGRGGIYRNEKKGYVCWCRAADLGHAVAWGRKSCALFYGVGVKIDRRISADCHIISAQLGNQSEFLNAADTCIDSRNNMMAAYWLQMENPFDLIQLLSEHPFECTPWGLWNPLDMDMQLRIMEPVRKAQFAWMLISKRLQIPKGVALMVTSFICTESGWKKK